MIRIGTASWTDPTLLASGRFYPVQARTPQARLQHYAKHFPLVEINTSYYGIGQPMQSHRWAQCTPADFRFHAKAFRLFTGHQTPVATLGTELVNDLGLRDPQATLFYKDLPGEWRDELWRRFLLWLEPMRLHDRLDAVHFQFPPWIRPHPRVHAHLEDIVHRMAPFTVAVEWRNRQWLTGAQCRKTLDWQRELGVVHTVVDAPQGFDNTVPAVWESTHPDMALVRLHGRNGQTWNHKGSASSGRFMYEYSEAELAELAAHIQRLAQTIARTHVMLNTNYEDQGVRNAQGLQQALSRAN